MKIGRQEIWTVLGLSVMVVAVAFSPFYEAPQSKSQPSCDLETMLSTMDSFGDVVVYRSAYSSYWKDKQPWSAHLKTDKSTGVEVEFRVNGSTVCEAVNNLYDKSSEWPLPTRKN